MSRRPGTFARLSLFIAVSSLVALFVPVAGHVGEDHETARRAVESGELRPLSEILIVAERDFPGTVIEVELERRRNGALKYEIEILTPEGRVIKVDYDGRTGQQIRVRDKTHKASH